MEMVESIFQQKSCTILFFYQYYLKPFLFNPTNSRYHHIYFTLLIIIIISVLIYTDTYILSSDSVLNLFFSTDLKNSRRGCLKDLLSSEKSKLINWLIDFKLKTVYDHYSNNLSYYKYFSQIIVSFINKNFIIRLR